MSDLNELVPAGATALSYLKMNWKVVLTCLLLIASGLLVLAQPPGGRRYRRDWQSVGRDGVPSWEVDKKFI
ncbi:MAG: hypothetical protein ACOVNQ_06620, partial [Pirellula sp.]